MSFSTVLEKGFLEYTNDKALKVIDAERGQYDQVWKVIEDYCKKHKLILSNKYVLVGDYDARDNIYKKIYKIYTSNPFRHANNLVNKIHMYNIKDENACYTRMKTLQENETFIIEYNMRQVVTINNLKKHKTTTESNKIVKPVEIKNQLYMPSELELIDIYHILYNPAMYIDREDASIYEKILFEQVLKRKEQCILGAGCRENNRDQLQALKIGIVSKWLPIKDFILIGPWAHDWIKLETNVCANNEKIQIIGDITPEKFKDIIQKFVSDMTKFNVTYRAQDLHIPKDSRTNRYTFYIQIRNEKGITEKPFLDLFNIASFEVVPCKYVHGMRIGVKEVILRFLFIDLWVIRVIKGMGYLTDDILNKKISYIWGLIIFFRNTYDISGETHYIGTNKDALIEKKMSALQSRTYYPYYPAAMLKSKNQYREI
jgi:hypothetical protein